MYMKRPVCSHIIAGIALLMLVAAFGCSSAPKMTVSSGEMYERGDLEEFVNRTGPPAGATAYYQFGIGDRLDIVFLYHSNLTSRELLVRDDGRISLPYVGDQMALGYTPMQLDTILTEKFAEILKEPNLSVILNEPAEKKVYVLGPPFNRRRRRAARGEAPRAIPPDGRRRRDTPPRHSSPSRRQQE